MDAHRAGPPKYQYLGRRCNQQVKTKRLIALMMVLVLAVAIVGLAGCKPKQEETPKQKIGLVFDVGGLGDKSFNDSAYAGLTKARDELGVDIQYLEPSEGGADREQLLRGLADEGYPLIFAVGFLFTDAVTAVAKDYPNTKFALIDGFIPDLTDTSNVVCIGFTEHEGSFLVGVAAALASKTGHIGFVGGMTGALIGKFEAGYVAGAKAVNPNIIVDVNYIGSTGDAFKDPTKGKELALAQYDNGCDVIYHASGASGIGVFEAAAARQKLAIGVDSDQYLSAPADQQPYILTSMLKRVDNSVYQTIDSFLKGTLKGGYATFNLAVGGVDYSKSNTTLLTADMITQIDAYKDKIISGEIVVPTEPGK